MKALILRDENVDFNESRQGEVSIVAWVTTGAAILTVGVKLFARAKIVQVVGLDDLFIFLSLVRLNLIQLVKSRFTFSRSSASSPRPLFSMESC
jgi:hypothetical protein